MAKREGNYKAGPGRPVKVPGLVRTTIYLTAEQRDWLIGRYGSIAEGVRSLIELDRSYTPGSQITELPY